MLDEFSNSPPQWVGGAAFLPPRLFILSDRTPIRASVNDTDPHDWGLSTVSPSARQEIPKEPTIIHMLSTIPRTVRRYLEGSSEARHRGYEGVVFERKRISSGTITRGEVETGSLLNDTVEVNKLQVLVSVEGLLNEVSSDAYGGS